ncbi:leucine-rich repeat-containing protein 24-like [Branchiostoma floridae]|uniref:Leucine-rich repeat-containing protein 24-like n=1 Tax=Branchiostoma floridae TaxID=7739 RepID=A0A9J7LGI2_BRAFL|nr:leucine-rich repeat-containing protein 24-like [Branchiostoma floridae]
MMQVTEYSDSSGRLRSFPRLNKLLTLILGPGSMQATGSETFSAVPNLQALSMSSNVIKVIGSWFGGITKLVKLDLSRNEIDHIMKNALQPLARLEYLILMYNRLSTVEDWYFAGLTSLKYLHLSYNNISHIAAKSFGYLSMLQSLSLDHNKLSSVNANWLQGLGRPAQRFSLGLTYNRIQIIPVESLATVRGWRGDFHPYVEANPYRCTCALDGLMSVGPRALGRVYSRLQCSYPPSLSGKKIADVERYEMPCPPPTAKVSHQDDGVTLVCEVFWEKQPEIIWLDPEGRDVRDGESASHCFSAVTAHLEHDIPTTQSPEGETAHSTSDSGLPYIGKSTSTLRLSQKAYRCWTEGSFRCIVQSTPGSVTVDLPLTKPHETSEGGQSHGEGGQSQHTMMAAVYTTTPVHAQQKARMSKSTVKSTKPHETSEGGQSLQHTFTVDLPLTKPRETSEALRTGPIHNREMETRSFCGSPAVRSGLVSLAPRREQTVALDSLTAGRWHWCILILNRQMVF